MTDLLEIINVLKSNDRLKQEVNKEQSVNLFEF